MPTTFKECCLLALVIDLRGALNSIPQQALGKTGSFLHKLPSSPFAVGLVEDVYFFEDTEGKAKMVETFSTYLEK